MALDTTVYSEKKVRAAMRLAYRIGLLNPRREIDREKMLGYALQIQQVMASEG